MPLKDFRWLEPEEAKLMDWSHMSDEQHTGYILEVDLFYPEHLHEAHNSFPLAPEQLVITEAILSPYAKGEKNSVSFGGCEIRTHARLRGSDLKPDALTPRPIHLSEKMTSRECFKCCSLCY